jgi:hypothetical protein
MEVSKLKFGGHSIHGVLPRPSRMQQETSNPLHHRSQNPRQQKPTHNPPTQQEPQSSPNPKIIPKLPNGDIPLPPSLPPSFIHSCNSHFAASFIIFHHLPISPKFPHSRITTLQTISIHRNLLPSFLPSFLHLRSRISGDDGLL